MMRLGRRGDDGTDDDVVIGHKSQHFGAVVVDSDQAVSGFGDRKIDLARLPKKLGQLFGRMVALAREQEAREPLGITYLVEDARTIVSQQDFDVVVAAYLLVYAQDRAELTRMTQGLASRVKPEGRFVTVTTNPGVYSFTPPDYGKYEIEMKLADHVFEGAPIEFAVLDGSGFRVVNYYLPLEAYESAFRAAGFHDFAVHMPELSAAPEAGEEGDYWDDILNYPFLITMECVRD